jgi:hypothetical protein
VARAAVEPASRDWVPGYGQRKKGGALIAAIGEPPFVHYNPDKMLNEKLRYIKLFL